MKKSYVIYNIFVVLIALLIALLVGAVLFAVAGGNPIMAYKVMLTEPLRGVFGITEMLVRAAPLMLVGVGVAVSFRSGILNIGGEGQILMGAVSGAFVGLSLPGLPKFLLIPLIFVAAFAGGALWGGIAGWLRAYLGVNEILSTVMLNYIAIQLYTYLLRAPLIDPQELAYGTGIPQTAQLTRNAWLERLIPGMRLHTGLIYAILIAIFIYLLLWKTTLGYRMRACGAEPLAARYAGMKVERYLVLAMVMAGGLAGLAGAVELCGVHRRALESLSAGYGFSGIVVALFGGLHPLGIIPASALFGLLIVGADMMQRAVTIPAHIILAIQGLIILTVVSSALFLTHRGIREKILGYFVRQPAPKSEVS
ncbi:MAG: ABC transporter permease [Synergistaceae bacterium]|jgi:simple sugar transport system permease protein|nr:ABC transporter permease [Synergistaceae bacterium]